MSNIHVKRAFPWAGIVIMALLVIFSLAIIGPLLSLIPHRVLYPLLWYVVLPVCVLRFFWGWFKWSREQRADQNELDCLLEVVVEHERDFRDNAKTIREQISCIERRHNLSFGAEMLLERARRAIELDEKIERDLEARWTPEYRAAIRAEAQAHGKALH
jgi:hypothetical protein